MKLEKEHVLGVQSPPRKSYNPFDSDDEIEAGNGYVKSNLNGYDIKSFETNADSLTFHLNSSDVSWEEAILTHSKILSHSIPSDLNGEEDLSRKDTELFTDKIVTECELPELVVCYKENAYHAVKDIGIDEGMPGNDNVSIKSREKHESENTPSFLGLDNDVDVDGDRNLNLPFMENVKSRSEKDVSSGNWAQDEGMPLNDFESIKSREKHGSENTPTFLALDNNVNGNLPFMETVQSMSEKDISSEQWPRDSVNDGGQDPETLEMQHEVDQCGVHDSTNLEEVKINSSNEQSSFSLESTVGFSDTCREAVSSKDPQLGEIGDSTNHKIEGKEQAIEDRDDNSFSPEKTHEPSTMASIPATSEASTESNESIYEETTSSLSPDLSASQESSDSGVANVLSYNSKVESGSIILDFNSATAKEKEEEKVSEHIETVAKPPEAQSMSRIDEGRVTDSSTDNRVHGETSFSAATAPPSSITYMGPFSHTGNISLRSESSAGSTRSFAFPVLQAEWNSSPVRMAKAEHRNRKQRGWVHSIMCCRF
ncbi:hypothetical protein RND81_07G174500 [Saponaria officinalis]|uniref:Uncharacterized protein n=1 Tax=Saponaria officinalis TaxID=3572 RepID=A0AAW1JSX7_SAPOF